MQKPATFRWALNASTIRPTPLLKKIEVAGAAGYEGIELWHDDIEAYLYAGGSIAELRSALDGAGLCVPTTIYLGGWFDCSETDFPRVLETCRKRMEQAAEVGARHVIAGPASGKADVHIGAKRYRLLLEEGLKRGVRPAMEFLGFVEQFNTLESAIEIIRIADHREATIVIDPFHIFRGGGLFASLSRLSPTEIAISHFNDTPSHPPRLQQHDRDRVMPGEGHLDLKGYVGLLKGFGYDGWLSLELFNEALWCEDPFEVARLGLEKMRSYTEA